MNREIKFRGICKSTGKFVYGNYIERIKPTEEKPVYWCCFIQDRAITMTGVLLASVGQFTGLKDKNGKEIYEGDIIESDNNMFTISTRKKDVVIFYLGCFKLNTGTSLYIITNPPHDFNPVIIGNIHENPELLK